MTIGPNFLAVARSMPSSENDAASPAQRPALLRLPSSEPSPPAIELSGLGGGAALSSLSAPGRSASNLLKSAGFRFCCPARSSATSPPRAWFLSTPRSRVNRLISSSIGIPPFAQSRDPDERDVFDRRVRLPRPDRQALDADRVRCEARLE